MSNQNEVAKQNKFETQLTKVNNTYLPMINRQLEGNGVNMDDYSKQCVIAAISTINNVLDTKGVKWNDPQLDQSNITQILLDVASLKLNAAANPREVYFQLRNVKKQVNGKDIWSKQIEMGIEGDGNDAILSRFGRDVKSVKQHWLVREEDHFVYPSYNGLEITPPQWGPTGRGKVIRVVYPIIKTDGSVEFYITERDDVTKNLIAHINNNLMNETFGIAKDRYKATPDQKRQINSKKQEILNKVNELRLKALDDLELQQYISPAWKDPQSRESMIIRKMRNNIVKKIPKDFGNAFVELTYDQNTDHEYKRVRKEINENANQELLDFDEVEEPAKLEQINHHEPVAIEENNEKPEPIVLDATGTEGPGF